MTGTYLPAAAGYLSGSLRHEVTAQAVLVPYAPLDLDLRDVEVTMAEDWAPHVQVRLTIPAPAAETDYEILDPRKRCRILIDAGYTYPDGVTDVQALAVLYLRSRGVRRPDNTVELTAASAESLAQDAKLDPWTSWTPNRGGLNEWVTWLASYAMYPEAPEIITTYAAGYDVPAVADIAVEAGMDCWSLIAEAASRTGAWVYVDGYGRWIITGRPEETVTPLHTVAVGEGGDVFGSTTELAREGFANTTLVTYRWQDSAGVDKLRTGWAVIESGPLSPQVAGRCVDVIERVGPINSAAANRVARSRLANLASRGRTVTLEAHAAYWLRPSQTLEMQLLTGAPERVLVRSVTWSPLTGAMTVATRQALNIPMTTGE